MYVLLYKRLLLLLLRVHQVRKCYHYHEKGIMVQLYDRSLLSSLHSTDNVVVVMKNTQCQ